MIYPNHIGYTGKALQTLEPLFYVDKSFTDEEYKEPDCKTEEEIDNFYQEPELESALYHPILDHKGRIQGILQLINFNHGPFSVTNRQLQEIGFTCEIIGTALHNLKEITEIMLCCTKLYDNIQKIQDQVVLKLGEYLNQVEGEIIGNFENHIIESVRNIQRGIQSIWDTQKIELFKDRILLNTYAEVVVEEKRREKMKFKVLKRRSLNKDKQVEGRDADKE